MISPSLASLHYEAKLKELGGIFAPNAHMQAIEHAMKETGATRDEVVEALRTFWTGRGAG